MHILFQISVSCSKVMIKKKQSEDGNATDQTDKSLETCNGRLHSPYEMLGLTNTIAVINFVFVLWYK